MELEVRIKVPGSGNWVITSIEEVWESWMRVTDIFAVATQAEANTLIGYSLVLGKVQIEVMELDPKALPNGTKRILWLQLVNVSPLV